MDPVHFVENPEFLEAIRLFRANLCAASYSRREMAQVMVEELRQLGYDVSAWDDGHSVRDDEYSEGFKDGQHDRHRRI